jgi:hypothetical protein
MKSRRGTNKRPDFASKEEHSFFENTPKRVLFEMLREASVLLASFEHEGYIDTWPDDPAIWMDQARSLLPAKQGLNHD